MNLTLLQKQKMLREHSDGVIRTFMEPDSLVVHMNQPCQPIPVTFDVNANLLLSPVGEVTYLRQHLVLMMWINVLCELGREHRYHYHETWNRMWTHIFRDEMLLHSPTWPCSLYHHTSYWLLWKEAQPRGIVLPRWVDTALNSCPRTLLKGGQNEFFIPLFHPSCHSEWCLWK